MAVDLTTPTDDVTYPWSEANRYWNTQVLSAMDRAGMIRLEWPTPPTCRPTQRKSSCRRRSRNTGPRCPPASWHGDLADGRLPPTLPRAQSMSRTAAAASMESATTILSGLDSCVNRYLADHYRLSVYSGVLPAPGNAAAARTAARTSCAGAAKQPVQPLSYGTLAVPPGRSARLAPDGRLCIWTDEPHPDAERELVDGWSARASWPWWPRAHGRQSRARCDLSGGRTPS